MDCFIGHAMFCTCQAICSISKPPTGGQQLFLNLNLYIVEFTTYNLKSKHKAPVFWLYPVLSMHIKHSSLTPHAWQCIQFFSTCPQSAFAARLSASAASSAGPTPLSASLEMLRLTRWYGQENIECKDPIPLTSDFVPSQRAPRHCWT